MGLFDQWPYTNFHELNLDWVLQALKELEHTIEQFVAINALKYADPIQWDITSQYEKNTIVIDPQSGTAYISVQAVPAGVALTDTNYWSVVFDLEQFVTKANGNFTPRVEVQTTTTATFNTPKGNLVIWGGDLYEALVNITAGDQYVVNSNIKRVTVEDIVGSRDALTTTDKSNLVAAINEVLSTIASTTGDLNDLNTTDKSNLVAAINEVLSTIASTTGDLNDLDTTDKSNLAAAINEVLSTIASTTGDLNDLTTTDKTSLVNAINEVSAGGSGSVTRLNNLKLINVLDYGAAGDDITDDTQAIQDALDQALSVKGFVYFPNGTYKITNTLKVGYGVSVIGENVEYTIIHRDDASTGDTMNFGDETTQSPASSFILSNIWFKRNLIYDESADTFTNKISNALAHVKVYKGQDFVINNCRFWDMPNDLILCGCTVGHVDECWFRPSIYYPAFTGKANLQEGMTALKIDKPTSENFHSQLITINKCYFSGHMTQSQYTQNCLGVNITQDWQCGAISAIEANSCESLIIDGCYFGGFSSQNINLYKNYMAVSEIRIVNNMFDSAGNTDISISNPLGNEGVNDVIIEHNVFNSQMHGYNNINVPNNGALFSAKNVSIIDNIFANSLGNCIMPTGIRGGIIANNRFTAYNCNGDYDNAILGNTAVYVLGIADYLDIHDNYFGGAVNTADYTTHCVNGIVVANGVSSGVLVNDNRGYVSGSVIVDQR